jgi:DNA-binding MarR family transcriptional regulator
MADSRTSNVVGALVLALSDDLMRAAQSKAPEIGPAAAALALLGHVPGMPIERLRRALGLSHPGAVRLVDRLERDGAAVRRQSQDDRRAVALSLTAKGGRVVGEILSAREASLAKALSGLSSAEQRAFGKLAEKMLRAMLENEDHAYTVCRLCDATACRDCPVEDELETRAS